MKKYTELTVNESLNMSKSTKDKFYVHAKNRLQHLKESGDYNNKIHGLFQDSFSEASLNQLLERFYNNNFKGSYESLIESFDLFASTKSEDNQRFAKSINLFCESLSKNPFDQTNHLQLKDVLFIDRAKTLNFLMAESCNVLKHIDVRNQFKSSLFESDDNKQSCLEIKDDPNYVLGLAESLSRCIRYSLQENVDDKQLVQKSMKFLESLNNIYSIYKEGMDLIKTQELQATEIFDLFMKDKATNYYFSTCNISKTLKEPASFIQLCLRYFDTWMNKHRNRLSYKFEVNTFERLSDMLTIYDAEHPLIQQQTVYGDEYYSFAKMYQLLDLMLNVSQYLRMDLRNLTCKYLTTIRPMIDSYRLDYQRSNVRTGY